MDGKHSLRLIFGNGLRSDVWKQMIGRFRIPSVAEFYAATEGGASLLNTDNVVGAIGFMSPAISGRILKLIKFDIDKDQPIRDQKGFCVAEKHGKPGLLVVPVDEKRPFSGYRGAKKLTESKLLRNVFRTGDVYFNTGDLLVQDENYYVYFKDRVGDTFRWRGENVATMEVAQIISELEFVADVCVYGVKIHGEEGRAGMASIILKSGQPEDYLRVLYDHIIKYLPSYARPLFLRFHKEFELTGTFKQKKTNLVKEGYDPQLVTDPLFYLCSERNSYTELKGNHRNLTTSSHGLKYVNAKL